MRDASVFGGVDEFHISLLIVCLESLETLVGNALNTLLFLAFCMCVERENGLAQAHDTILCRAIHRKHLPPVSTDDAELLDMLLLSTSLAINALLALEILCHVGVTYRWLPCAAEIRAIKWEQGTMREALGDHGT